MKEAMCSKCGTVKPRSEFHSRSASSTGIQHKCKECSAKYAKTYSRNKEVVKKYNALSATRQKKKEWREENRDYASKYYLLNKEKFKERSLKFYYEKRRKK